MFNDQMNYHIRRSEREIANKDEILDIIGKCKYAVIGLSSDDQPYVVTLSYGFDRSLNALYFHCAKEGHKIDIIMKNPRACATIIEDDGFDSESCDHSYRSLVIRGTIKPVDNKDESDHAVKLMICQLEKKDPGKFMNKLITGNKSYDNLRILRMDIENVTGKARKA
jgi:nitroimidazol reductase NimA-like FMN-containing flavoprotein (pyridoxamine 5'-phosphate oxidase superfamily)